MDGMAAYYIDKSRKFLKVCITVYKLILEWASESTMEGGNYISFTSKYPVQVPIT